MLATSIAETSLTIEGVRIVIDCGLARVPRYEPVRGLTPLETVVSAPRPISGGRAGRTEPGVCYRLWDEAVMALWKLLRRRNHGMDLSGFLLDCLAWGARDPWRDLRFSIRRLSRRSMRRARCSSDSARSTRRAL